VQLLDLLLGDVHFLQARLDLSKRQEPSFLSFRDQRTQLIELRNRSFIGQQNNPLMAHGP